MAFILALSILCSCIIGAVSVYAEQVNSQTSISQNNSSSNSTDNSSTNDEETTDIVGENISLYAEASEEVRNFKIQSAKRVSTGTTPLMQMMIPAMIHLKIMQLSDLLMILATNVLTQVKLTVTYRQ